ncbi:hypothetical protein [Streptomyces sp. NBC_00083]|uniref:hypothetical protein n=1 Tax=Streptomyces sp. NBC_00083 TaxID=2975647 RepID=UPI0022568872|nr:hypothetical protein [Streptomyces sp. NBC_00083]MCX5385575.1 hypothetical protein [Streptomyces sp. NBC_00083]
MRARFRSVAALLLPVAAAVAFALTAQGHSAAPDHAVADSAVATAATPVPTSDPGDGFSWG